MCPKDTDAPPEKLKPKLLKLDMDGDECTGKGDTIFPFHHSLNGGGIKNQTIVCCSCE